MNIGLIGFGAINQDIYKYFLRNNNFNVNFKKILVRNFENYVKHDLSIITEFNDYFSLENKITFRHDSDPPSALKEDDLAFVAGVIFSF